VLFPHIWSSPDALTWNDAKIPQATGGIGCIAYGAGNYVATGSIPGKSHYDWIRGTIYWDPDSPLILASADGHTWHQETAPSPLLYYLAYGQRTFVATARVLTNALGIYQTDALVPRFAPDAHLSSQSFQGTIISEPGDGFRVQRSSDLNSWTDVGVFTNAAERTFFSDSVVVPASRSRFYRVLPPKEL
jgi:hypothetical protein